MTGGPGFQVAIGRVLARLFRRIEIWTAPVPQPVLGLALLALAAAFAVAALHGRRRPPELGQDPDLDPNPDPDLDAAGQPAAPADSGTGPVNASAGHDAAADHRCHAPARSQS
jgi:cytochrome c-type biogenesis protein